METSLSTLASLKPSEWRSQFPLLEASDVVYLDTAASAQKPRVVLEAIERFYREGYANIHRGVYPLSVEATEKFDATRTAVARYLNAPSPEQVIFTRGATEALNLVAYSWARTMLQPGDEIVVSLLEHHSNFVPWQMAAENTGATIRFVAPDEDGILPAAAFDEAITSRTKLVALTHLSNALGVVPPVRDVITKAHAVGAKVIVDAAQAAAHLRLDVQALDVDFLAFSAHKVYGPTGVGVLFGRREQLEAMPPFLGGGDMIRAVSVRGTTYAGLPSKFEAGTPNIAGVIGLGAALRFVEEIGLERMHAYEDTLLQDLTRELLTIDGIRVLGGVEGRAAVCSMVIDGVHALDAAELLGV
ncbi:MAG: aminotransferase class V-fold PLP-dependent enzyme, partial [Bdellovibrionales bacterium]|nr:aminotransferase class V-fold PLP-dependent enzyme [Bdellovibrionales bacterium]